MRILSVDGCPRGEASRTRQLARICLQELQDAHPDWQVTHHVLSDMQLEPLRADTLARREEICNRLDWSAPAIRPAAELQQADAVVIAAPYWDLSFPASVKVWVEHVWVRNLTFVYHGDQPVGLLQARAALYITTAGGWIGRHDWGAGYLEDVLHILGVPEFRTVRVEGLDLDGQDVHARMQAGRAEVLQASHWLQHQLCSPYQTGRP